MAAPKAPSELGQSWAGLITAAVLLFVPPPQDGALLARYITARYVLYRPTYIPGSTCTLSSIWIDHLLFSAREISTRLDRVTPGVVCYSHFLILPFQTSTYPPSSSSSFLPFFYVFFGFRGTLRGYPCGRIIFRSRMFRWFVGFIRLWGFPVWSSLWEDDL